MSRRAANRSKDAKSSRVQTDDKASPESCHKEPHLPSHLAHHSHHKQAREDHHHSQEHHHRSLHPEAQVAPLSLLVLAHLPLLSSLSRAPRRKATQASTQIGYV